MVFSDMQSAKERSFGIYEDYEHEKTIPLLTHTNDVFIYYY